MDVRQEGCVPGKNGVSRGIEGHMAGHHHSICSVLRFTVDYNGIHRVSFNPGRPQASSMGHGVEADFMRVRRSLQDILEGGVE